MQEMTESRAVTLGKYFAVHKGHKLPFNGKIESLT